ncbi:hypothetical protein OROGR_000184 [Orobanche gracilis]
MDILLDHRPHFRTTRTDHVTTTTTPTTTNELFICFTSRLSSSSSMKLTKSILSPGRAARDGAVSLSSSLSRRHRSNCSLKGGASPFLTANAGKRRGGGGFENPEPSSPKVTCIGQVRVKTKKKAKHTRSLSRRRSGEISFRKAEKQHTADNNGGDKDRDRDALSSQQAQIRYYNGGGGEHYHKQPQQQHAQECSPHKNQRWVHLPLISCLLPCKSSCFSRNKDDENKQNGSDENLCGSVSARWLVSVNDSEDGKRREIELVVGGGDEEEETPAGRISMRSSRRHVFDDIEVKHDRIEINGQSLEGGGEEKARVSICIPPKNALLLMRCRSDPMEMASVGSRFSWDAQGVWRNDSEKVEEDSGEQDEDVKAGEGKYGVFEENATVLVENNGGISDEVDQENLEPVEDGGLGQVEVMVVENETEELQQENIMENISEKLEEEEEEVESNMSSFEALLNQENSDDYENSPIQDEDDREVKVGPSTESDTEIKEKTPVLGEEEALMEKENEEEESNTIVAEKDPTFVEDGIEEHRVAEAQGKSDPKTTQQENEEKSSDIENGENQDSLNGNIDEEPKKEKESTMLPDCLLLMMCEPKLSMEVSKETWVCSTDFIRWLPERPTKAVKATSGDQERVQRRPSTDSKPNKPQVRNNNDQQQRSSCSLPAAAAAASMATMIEQKLTNAAAYEPFVLTRCKSEPMRTAATKLMPELCFWKNAVAKSSRTTGGWESARLESGSEPSLI